MFTKSRKDKFVEQAQDLAHDLSDAIAPHVERARDELAPRLADARDHARDAVAPRLADARDAARDAVAPRFNDAKDAVSPRFNDARDVVAPRLSDARDAVAPHVGNARDKFLKDVVPAVQQALSDARDQAAPVAEEAQRRGALAAAALKGEPVQKKGGKKKYLLLAGLLGLGAVAYSKLKGGSSESTNWQSSYSPTPAPAAPPVPASPSAPMAGSHVAKVPADGALGGDAGGAAPGESLSDAAEQPHPVTTPDSPAEAVDVSDVEDPKV